MQSLLCWLNIKQQYIIKNINTFKLVVDCKNRVPKFNFYMLIKIVSTQLIKIINKTITYSKLNKQLLRAIMNHSCGNFIAK